MSAYIDFVRDAVRTLLEKQSARLAGASYGPRCITVTGSVNRRYRSLGARRGESFYTIVFDDRLPQPSPTTMDFGIWPTLDELTELTGDSEYHQLVEDMADAFVDYGFDPRSGLAYFGAMTHFDVVRLGPSPYLGSGAPGFKFTSDLPFEILWAKAPEKMDRMFKAFFWGMITRPETMDFNRYCYYGFDDRKREHVLPYSPGHVAFVGAAAWMIEAWAFHYAKTGDEDSLVHAAAMTDKWQALQDPDTGLVPHFLGSKKEGEDSMTAQTYCNVGDSGTAGTLLRAAELLRSRQQAASLSERLSEMGGRLISGIARFGRDPERCIFYNWLRVPDGQPHTESYTYHFHSQEQREYWVQRDATLADVAVHAGSDYYGAGPSSWACGVPVPLRTAQAAEMTGDAFLLARARFFADGIMDAAAALSGPRNAEGQWTFPASASYVLTMLHLHRLTGDADYVERARRLADMEIEFLSEPLPEGVAEWWRMPFRNQFLAALLALAVS